MSQEFSRPHAESNNMESGVWQPSVSMCFVNISPRWSREKAAQFLKGCRSTEGELQERNIRKHSAHLPSATMGKALHKRCSEYVYSVKKCFQGHECVHLSFCSFLCLLTTLTGWVVALITIQSLSLRFGFLKVTYSLSELHMCNLNNMTLN